MKRFLKKLDHDEDSAKVELSDKMERFARCVKVVGQVSEIIAGSIQVINKAYQEKDTIKPEDEKSNQENDAVDLTGIMTGLNDLVKSVADPRNSSGVDQEIVSS